MVDSSNVIIAFVGIIVGVVLCVEQGKVQNPWQVNNLNNGFNSQVLQTNKSTTPWPTLNQRRNQLPSQNNAHNQPMWVQNGSNWVRNSPMPSQSVPFSNMNSNRPQNNIVRTVTSPKTIMSGQNKQNSPVNFVTTPRMPTYNNRNNVNVNFLNSERTKFAGGTFSSGSFSQSQDNTTYNSSRQSGSDVDDNELREFSEALLNKDTNNAAKYVTLNVQKMTSSRSTVDEAPLPLLNIDQAAFAIPSISKVLPLYNNYILETNQNEVYTAQEKLEENDLLDTILPTSVMQHTRNFLIQKGKIGRDPKEFKDLLRTLWFNMYSRGGGRIGSSGFEHIFLGELKNKQVSGLHNWLYFYDQEKKNAANYLGYMKKLDLGNKGAILKFHFVFHDTDKPVGSMFVGTSPELEMALYTTCFVLRADKICPLKLNGNRFIIRTYTFRYRGKNMIGSAFPEI